MVTNYEKEILQKLVAVYERRYHNVSDLRRKISVKFNETGYKKYVSENAYKYRAEIDEATLCLEKKGFIHIKYCKGTDDIEEVSLILDNILQAYEHIGKTGIEEGYQQLFNELLELGFEVSNILHAKLKQAREHGQSLQKYIENKEKYFDALRAMDAISKLKKDTYLRNLSVSIFRDSKKMEKLIPCIMEIYTLINNNDIFTWDEYALQHGVLKNPNYVFMKGSAIIKVNEQIIDLAKLNTSFALSSEVLSNVEFISIGTDIVTTIENLTTFHAFEDAGLAIYLGGFSNHSKVKLLKIIKKCLPYLCFKHFGDIDLGGFTILSHLRKQTEIEIKPLHMDIASLKQFEEYCKNPERGYIEKIKALLLEPSLNDCFSIIRYMIEKGIILEQEACDDINRDKS